MNDLRGGIHIHIATQNIISTFLAGIKKTCVAFYCEKLLKQWNPPIRHASRNFSEPEEFLGIKQKFQ